MVIAIGLIVVAAVGVSLGGGGGGLAPGPRSGGSPSLWPGIGLSL